MFGKINDPALEDIQVGLMLYINKLLAYIDGQATEEESAFEKVVKKHTPTQLDILKKCQRGVLTLLTPVDELFDQGETTDFRVLENGNLLLGECYEFDIEAFAENVKFVILMSEKEEEDDV